MAKIVRYNGGKMSYYSCTKPTHLVVGKKYEVTFEYDRGFQTDYTLKGVNGYFNSVWFDDITFIALARDIPVLGKRFKCSKLEFVNGRPMLTSCNTSIVIEVSDRGNNIYEVNTNDCIYIVIVG